MGYTVFVQAWDIAPGHDFAHEMHVGLQRAARVVAVLSPAYLEVSPFGEAEWRSAFAGDPSGEGRALVPVRVAACEPRGLLGTRVYVDLVGKAQQEAREALLRGARGEMGPPATPPAFPGRGGVQGARLAGGPRFPGALPEVFGVPFTPNPRRSTATTRPS